MPDSFQNMLRDSSQIVKHTELVPYRRPNGLRDVSVERRAIRDYYLRLGSKLVEVQEELEQLLLVGSSAQMDAALPIRAAQPRARGGGPETGGVALFPFV